MTKIVISKRLNFAKIHREENNLTFYIIYYINWSIFYLYVKLILRSRIIWEAEKPFGNSNVSQARHK